MDADMTFAGLWAATQNALAGGPSVTLPAPANTAPFATHSNESFSERSDDYRVKLASDSAHQS
jgi:hypothetical protein